jgi:hypothetical protein
MILALVKLAMAVIAGESYEAIVGLHALALSVLRMVRVSGYARTASASLETQRA